MLRYVSIVTGTVIGAGILSLPYVFSKAGFPISFFWLILVYILILIVAVQYMKITLYFEEKHQFPGYVEKVLGKHMKYIVMFLMILSIYGTIISYFIAQVNSLSNLFGISKNIALIFLSFLLFLVLYRNISGVENFTSANLLIIIAFLIGSSIYFLSFYDINLSNLMKTNFSYFLYPINPIIFSLFGLSAIPEVREVVNNEKVFRKIIIIGWSIPLVLYIIFVLSILLTQSNIPPIATFLLGNIGYLLTLLITLNPLMTMSYSLKEIFMFDLKLDDFLSNFLVIIPPIAFVYLFNNPKIFVDVISLVGFISTILYFPLIGIMYIRTFRRDYYSLLVVTILTFLSVISYAFYYI